MVYLSQALSAEHERVGRSAIRQHEASMEAHEAAVEELATAEAKLRETIAGTDTQLEVTP